MYKKLVTSVALLLSVSPAVSGVLMTTSVSADTVNSTIKSNVSPRDIGGRYNGEIRGGMGIDILNIGYYEYVVKPFIRLEVIDGGPESLSWSAAIYNATTNELVNDWQEFKHGSNNMIFNINQTKVHVGDQLQVHVHANSGEGYITFLAS